MKVKVAVSEGSINYTPQYKVVWESGGTDSDPSVLTSAADTAEVLASRPGSFSLAKQSLTLETGWALEPA
jgi:hypothetical protein